MLPSAARIMEQTYDISKSYQFNYDRGPAFRSAAPPLPAGQMKTFLGVPVRSRLGIAAGILLNGKWISGYAQRGFDILTYKTVRSVHRPCYDLPNWVFVTDEGREDGPVYATDQLPDDPARISSAVCFGMPSMAPEVWRADVRRAKAALREGQMLIVSVVATPKEGATAEDLGADFAECARWAAESGADAIEANFSCPNVCSGEGTIYMDSDLSHAVAVRIRATLGPKIPLLIKTGHIADQTKMRTFLKAINGVAEGITLVNCIVRPVLHRDRRPVFGEAFRKVGVLGRTIHRPSVEAVRMTSRIVREAGLNLAIAAVGGASQPGDVKDFFDAGADAVLFGSAPMYLPSLAAQLKALHPEW